VSWSITDSYRTYEGQNKIFDWDYYNKTKKKRKKGTSGTPAAYPGTSNHGWGAAVDIGVKYGDKAHNWLTKNASRFGFSNPFKDPRTEPWHWEHLSSAKKLGANVSINTSSDTYNTSSSTSSDTTPSTDSGGSSLLKGMLSKGLGLDTLTQGFLSGSVNEEINRIKKLMK